MGAEPVGDGGPGETGATGATGAVPGPVGVGEVGEVGIPPVGEGTGESLSIKHGASPQTEQASPLSRILKGADFSASSQERKRCSEGACSDPIRGINIFRVTPRGKTQQVLYTLALYVYRRIYLDMKTKTARACAVRVRTYSVMQQASAPRSGENLEHPTPPHEPHSAAQHAFPSADSTP